MKARTVKITARKHMGDDACSWAVFADGLPVVTGLQRSEVAYYKRQVKQLYDERELKRRVAEARGE